MLIALRNVLRQFSQSLVFLFETRLAGAWATGVRFSIRYSNGFSIDYVGRSGGLLLVGKEDLDVKIRSYLRGLIDALVVSHRGIRWRFTGFYGNPHASNRRFSWDLLRRLKGMVMGPWLCRGDFNELKGGW